MYVQCALLSIQIAVYTILPYDIVNTTNSNSSFSVFAGEKDLHSFSLERERERERILKNELLEIHEDLSSLASSVQ